MKTVVKKLYEGMFLIDSSEAAADWDGVETTIKNILEKSGAEVVSMKKWHERRLAYEIKGKSRGTYILCYFRADGEKIRDIERDAQLSERIMRVLILSTEAMSQEDINKDTPAMRAESGSQETGRQPEWAERSQRAAEAVAAAEAKKQPVEQVSEPERSGGAVISAEAKKQPVEQVSKPEPAGEPEPAAETEPVEEKAKKQDKGQKASE